MSCLAVLFLPVAWVLATLWARWGNRRAHTLVALSLLTSMGWLLLMVDADPVGFFPFEEPGLREVVVHNDYERFGLWVNNTETGAGFGTVVAAILLLPGVLGIGRLCSPGHKGPGERPQL